MIKVRWRRRFAGSRILINYLQLVFFEAFLGATDRALVRAGPCIDRALTEKFVRNIVVSLLPIKGPIETAPLAISFGDRYFLIKRAKGLNAVIHGRN